MKVENKITKFYCSVHTCKNDQLEKKKGCQNENRSGNLCRPTITKTYTFVFELDDERNLIMADLRSKCGHYIFVLWFLLLYAYFLA